MTNLSPETCRKLRDARKGAHLSQQELADELGCRQSALSMFEQGDGTKLNDEAVTKWAKKFGIALQPATAAESPAGAPVPAFSAASAARRGTGFCPNPACPSNRAYLVEDRRFLKPERGEADPVGGRFCALCGERLERRCPTCGAPVHDGAVCSHCGEPYVPVL